MKRIAYLLTLLIAGALTISSCVKKEFDAPADTTGYDPQLNVTHTIRQMRWMNGTFDYRTGGDTTIITQDVVVSGIVTADDRSGNLYKQILVEDSTGGIMVLIDNYNLYNDYPVGRKVYIRCKGLQLGYDGGLPVLGMKAAEGIVPMGIAPAVMTQHIVKADVGHTVTPKTVTLAQIRTADSNYYNRLITITEAEFVDTTKTYTQPNGTTNRDIQDCNGNKIPVRSSNYSNFNSFKLPAGRGSVTGIYTVFISSTSGSRTAQLVIRDTADVKFYGPRCGSGPVTPVATISVDSLRKLYPGTGTTVLPSLRIKGVVISDRANGNVDTRNLVLQDGSRGITVRFSAAHSFNLGDSLLIDISGAQLGEYNSLLEVGAVASGSTFTVAKATKAGTGNVTPANVTIGMINANLELYESTLVKIANATASGGATFVTGTNGNKTLTDASGSITLYTTSASTFASTALPAGPKTWTGVVGQFGTTRQLQIRNMNDIQ